MFHVSSSLQPSKASSVSSGNILALVSVFLHISNTPPCASFSFSLSKICLNPKDLTSVGGASSGSILFSYFSFTLFTSGRVVFLIASLCHFQTVNPPLDIYMWLFSLLTFTFHTQVDSASCIAHMSVLLQISKIQLESCEVSTYHQYWSSSLWSFQFTHPSGSHSIISICPSLLSFSIMVPSSHNTSLYLKCSSSLVYLCTFENLLKSHNSYISSLGHIIYA